MYTAAWVSPGTAAKCTRNDELHTATITGAPGAGRRVADFFKGFVWSVPDADSIQRTHRLHVSFIYNPIESFLFTANIHTQGWNQNQRQFCEFEYVSHGATARAFACHNE